jgi:hypothetical protein
MKYANFLLVLVSSAITYGILEVALYFALCFGLRIPAHPYFDYVHSANPKVFTNDPVIGWRFSPGEANSSIRVADGEVQYSAEDVIGNSAGFHSRLEYTPQKGRHTELLFMEIRTPQCNIRTRHGRIAFTTS